MEEKKLKKVIEVPLGKLEKASSGVNLGTDVR